MLHVLSMMYVLQDDGLTEQNNLKPSEVRSMNHV